MMIVVLFDMTWQMRTRLSERLDNVIEDSTGHLEIGLLL